MAPLAAQEMAMAAWLIAKGFNRSATLLSLPVMRRGFGDVGRRHGADPHLAVTPPAAPARCPRG
jgi:hypothetical protein